MRFCSSFRAGAVWQYVTVTLAMVHSMCSVLLYSLRERERKRERGKRETLKGQMHRLCLQLQAMSSDLGFSQCPSSSSELSDSALATGCRTHHRKCPSAQRAEVFKLYMLSQCYSQISTLFDCWATVVSSTRLLYSAVKTLWLDF